MTPEADTAEVRPGDELDWAALEAHLRSVLELPHAPMQVRQFTAGRANLTYLVQFGDERLVVRRPPRGELAPGSHDMAREFRVLSRLAPVYSRAPRALHFCDDPSVIGAPFVVLERRVGEVVRDEVPESMRDLPDASRRISNAIVDAAADLHLVDTDATGLIDLGKPEGFAARQVDGWRRRWDRVAPPNGPRGMVDIADELARTVPTPPRVSVVHNDLKLDNCQFAPGEPDVVTSVFDWDMATVGDPLFDLANLSSSMRSTPAWVLSDDAMLERYAARTGVDVSAFGWYAAFASWRSAVVVQQLYDRYARGESADERLAHFGALVPDIVRHTEALLAAHRRTTR